MGFEASSLPPGQKGYPIVANVFDFPENPTWEGFAKMAQEHGKRWTFSRWHPDNTDELQIRMSYPRISWVRI